MFRYTFYPEYDTTEVLAQYQADEKLSHVAFDKLLAEVEACNGGIMAVYTEEEI